MFRTVSLSIIWSHTAIGICHTGYADCLLALHVSDSAKLLMIDRDTPKHVEFYSKTEFEKLVHLVGFIVGMLIRTYEKQRMLD